VQPALPTGLSLDSTTGVISGTPTAAQTASAYTLTGTSGANTATTSVTIGVSLANQAALTVSAAASSIAVNATTTLSTSGGSGSGAVTYAVTSGPCAISNTQTLSGTGGAGLCSITATKAANSTYDAITSSPITVTVTLAPQTTALVASASPATLNVNATSTLSTTGGNGSGAVVYEVVSGACGIVGTTLTGTGAGSCSVTATKAADSTYAAVTASPISVTVQLNPQTALVATATAVSINVNGTSQLNTSGGSGTGAVSYAVAAGGPCSINGNILTGTSAGTCTVTASKAADTAYAAATANALTITVNRNDPTALVASASPTSINVNGTSSLTTTGGSGTGAVSFNRVSGPCTVSGTSLTGTGAGTCLFTATQAQDSDFNATTSAPVSVIVGLSPQSTLTVLAAPTTLSTGGSSQLSSTGGDGTGAVTYEVVNGACSLSGNTLTSAFSGSCAVIATKAADSLYAVAVSAPLTVTVGLSPQSALTAVASPSTIAVNDTSSLSSTGGSGTGEVFYTLVSGPCQLGLNTLTGTGAGSCVITATKGRDQTYSDVTSSPLIVTVGLAPQSALSVVAAPTAFNVGATSTLSTTGGSGTGTVTYTLVDGPCSLSGNTVTGKQAGTCQVTATRAADTTYAEITSSPLALTVGLAPQSPLSLLGNPSSINVGGTSNLGSTGGSGTGNVLYSLVSGPCSLSGAVLSGISVGSCVVTATKAADDRYASVNASPLTLTVGLAPQSALTGLINPSSLQVYGTATLSATGGSGTGALSFSLVSGPCSVSGSTLAGLSEGSCTLTASKAEDASYAAAVSPPFTVAVGLAPQSALSVLASPSAVLVNGTSDLSVTGGSGSGSVSYNLLSGPCSLSGSTLTGLDAGSCVVTATQAASDGYAAATADPVTVTVGLAPQSPLTLSLAPVSLSSRLARTLSASTAASAIAINVNETAVLSAAGGSGTGQVTYQLLSGPCAIAGNRLTGLDAGTCAVVATKAADALYAAQTSAPMLIIVGLTAQPPLEVSASPSTLPLAGISTLSTAGGNGAGAVSYSVISGPCAITGTSVSGIGVGSCTITATKAASGSYAATTSAPLTITVGLSVQPPMTLTATPASVRIGGTSELNVSGGGGVGFVTYNVLSGPCAVSGSFLIGVEAGACSVSATKASDGVYASVTSAPLSVTVASPAPPPRPIPTLSQWAQGLMMLSMIGIAGYGRKRRLGRSR
jgi:ribosomal protein S11